MNAPCTQATFHHDLDLWCRKPVFGYFFFFLSLFPPVEDGPRWSVFVCLAFTRMPAHGYFGRVRSLLLCPSFYLGVGHLSGAVNPVCRFFCIFSGEGVGWGGWRGRLTLIAS